MESPALADPRAIGVQNRAIAPPRWPDDRAQLEPNASDPHRGRFSDDAPHGDGVAEGGLYRRLRRGGQRARSNRATRPGTDRAHGPRPQYAGHARPRGPQLRPLAPGISGPSGDG